MSMKFIILREIGYERDACLLQRNGKDSADLGPHAVPDESHKRFDSSKPDIAAANRVFANSLEMLQEF